MYSLNLASRLSGALAVMRATRESRHQQIEAAMVREIAKTLRQRARDRSRLLHLQARDSQQTLAFHVQLRAGEIPVIYDSQDARSEEIRARTDFVKVDIEQARFPSASGHFDVVVWNRELVTVRNARSALLEVQRVLRPAGLLLLAIPNLAALHNRVLLAAGRQPTTLHVGTGDHIRGYATSAMTQFLRDDLRFEVLGVKGIGLAPLTGASMPRPFRGLSHSVLWTLSTPTISAR